MRAYHLLAAALIPAATTHAALSPLLDRSFSPRPHGRADLTVRAAEDSLNLLLGRQSTCGSIGEVPCGPDSCRPESATCCDDGTYCRAGLYCDDGGCCPDGETCSGGGGTIVDLPTTFPSVASFTFSPEPTGGSSSGSGSSGSGSSGSGSSGSDSGSSGSGSSGSGSSGSGSSGGSDDDPEELSEGTTPIASGDAASGCIDGTVPCGKTCISSFDICCPDTGGCNRRYEYCYLYSMPSTYKCCLNTFSCRTDNGSAGVTATGSAAPVAITASPSSSVVGGPAAGGGASGGPGGAIMASIASVMVAVAAGLVIAWV